MTEEYRARPVLPAAPFGRSITTPSPASNAVCQVPSQGRARVSPARGKRDLQLAEAWPVNPAGRWQSPGHGRAIMHLASALGLGCSVTSALLRPAVSQGKLAVALSSDATDPPKCRKRQKTRRCSVQRAVRVNGELTATAEAHPSSWVRWDCAKMASLCSMTARVSGRATGDSRDRCVAGTRACNPQRRAATSLHDWLPW